MKMKKTILFISIFLAVIIIFSSLSLAENYSGNCVTPTDGMIITEDTTFCPGTYNIPNGITIGASNIILDCNNAVLNGDGTKNGISTNNISVTIKNCVVNNFWTGIKSLGSNNIIQNNVVSSSTYSAIGVSSGDNVLNNKLKDNKIGIDVYRVNTFVIKGNTITRSIAYGVLIYGNENGNSINGEITDNIITDCGWDNYTGYKAGISLAYDSYNNSIHGNTLTNNQPYNFWLRGEYASRFPSQNKIWDNDIYTTNLYDEHEASNTYCVNCIGNNYYNGATGPTCPDNDGDGFTSDVDCNDNNASIHPPSNGMAINKSTIFCNGTYYLPNGIVIAADNIVLDCNNAIILGDYRTSQTVSSGIKIIEYNNITIKNCIIENYLWNFNLENSNHNTFLDNIGRFGGSGFRIMHSDSNTFIKNEGYGNEWYGFIIYSKNSLFKDNIASDNRMAGFTIQPYSSEDYGNQIINNKIEGNRRGISLRRSQNNFNILIENNTIKNNNLQADSYGVSLGGCGSYPCKNSSIVFRGNNLSGNPIGIHYTRDFCNDELEFNNIEDNSVYNLVIHNPFGPTGYSCDSTWQKNWWGTADLIEIENKISGEVDFIPFLCEPHPTNFISNEDGLCIGDQDSDDDGVLDKDDLCPGTIEEQIVYGCSCNQILNLKPGENKGELKNGCSKGTIKVFTKLIGWAKNLFG